MFVLRVVKSIYLPYLDFPKSYRCGWSAARGSRMLKSNQLPPAVKCALHCRLSWSAVRDLRPGVGNNVVHECRVDCRTVEGRTRPDHCHGRAAGQAEPLFLRVVCLILCCLHMHAVCFCSFAFLNLDCIADCKRPIDNCVMDGRR